MKSIFREADHKKHTPQTKKKKKKNKWRKHLSKSVKILSLGANNFISYQPHLDNYDLFTSHY